LPILYTPYLPELTNEYIEKTNQLPAFLLYEGRKIGTGSLLALFSEMFVKIQASKLPDQLRWKIQGIGS